MRFAYYHASIPSFVSADDPAVVGELDARLCPRMPPSLRDMALMPMSEAMPKRAKLSGKAALWARAMIEGDRVTAPFSLRTMAARFRLGLRKVPEEWEKWEFPLMWCLIPTLEPEGKLAEVVDVLAEVEEELRAVVRQDPGLRALSAQVARLHEAARFVLEDARGVTRARLDFLQAPGHRRLAAEVSLGDWAPPTLRMSER